MTSFLHDLNATQREAVQSQDEALLVSAGAGTGKTRVLTFRYAHLAQNLHVDPQAIMAVTFTNKAAQELKNRLGRFFPVQNLWIGTFHALGLRMLRQKAELVGRRCDFTVLDSHDQIVLVQKILKNLGSQQVPRVVFQAISQAKQSLEPPSHSAYSQIQKLYQEQLITLNAMDFDDLVFLSLKLLQDHPDVLKEYQLSHILVDEYQDINALQYLWVKAIKDAGAHIFCVGDEDQAIYGWRGASVEKIMNFNTDFTPSRVLMLQENYRSSGHILSAASHLISHNKARYAKVLQTQREDGEKIHIQGLWDNQEEAAFIAGEIVKLHLKGQPLSSMAVLVRTGAQTRTFEERFGLQGIAYHLVGNTRFYDRLEVRDMMAYMRLILSPLDNLSFERAIGAPRRGIGAQTLQILYQQAKEENLSLEQAARQSPAKKNMMDFLEQLDRWRGQIHQSPAQLARKILEDSGYGAYWETQGVAGQTRLENIQELIQAMEPFETLESFLEHTALVADLNQDSATRGVHLMTLHSAKGLEFDIVFLPGWEDNMFPHIRAIEEGNLEEERRLAYVGLTRAKVKAMVTFCWHRTMNRGLMPCVPSRFIKEIPAKDCLVILGNSGQSKTSNSGYSKPAMRNQCAPVPPKTPSSKIESIIKKKVFHPLFGDGIVEEQKGSMISVSFEKHGLKKVMDRFLEFIS